MKNLKATLLIVLLIIVTMSCKSKLSHTDLVNRNVQLDELTIKVEQGNYQINMNAAFPLNTNAVANVLNNIVVANGDTANRIELADRGDVLKLSKDKVEAVLSYYGERRLSSGYGNDESGIVFNGVPINYEQSVDYEKGAVKIKYEIRNKSESFDVRIEINSNGNANVNVASTHRSSIRYTGNLMEVKITSE